MSDPTRFLFHYFWQQSILLCHMPKNAVADICTRIKLLNISRKGLAYVFSTICSVKIVIQMQVMFSLISGQSQNFSVEFSSPKK